MSIDKNLLKRFTLLYVEDDDMIRELSQLLMSFFLWFMLLNLEKRVTYLFRKSR